MGVIDEVKEIIEDVRQVRDEVEVKVGLGKLEAKEAWEEAEKKWDTLSSKGKQVVEEAEDTAKGTLEAVKLLGEEIKKGYDNIKKIL